MTPYYRLLLGALDDFMLKFLLVCALIDLIVEVGFAEDDERSHGKDLITSKELWFSNKLGLTK